MIPSYDWITAGATPTRGALGNFYVVQSWRQPRGDIFAFGSTLMIHPLDLAGIEARQIVRARMFQVLTWLRLNGIEP